MAKKSSVSVSEIVISKINEKILQFKIKGSSPYVQNKFPDDVIAAMKEKQLAGSTGNSKKLRKPKDFDRCYANAQYAPTVGKWPNGAIPSTQIKASLVNACRNIEGLSMVAARQCLYVEADGYDPSQGIPLIKITKGKPHPFEQALRVANGNPDIRIRPMWDTGWEAIVKIRYDADKFTPEDVANLLNRAGAQVGIGEGRMASKSCVGMGWGCFKIAGK